MNQPKEEKFTQPHNRNASPFLRRYLLFLGLGCFALSSLTSFAHYTFQSERQDRQLIKIATQLAQTTLAGEDLDEGEILLKVNDLISLEAVLGLRLVQGGATPLSVGAVAAQLPLQEHKNAFHQWSQDKTSLDIALPIKRLSPFDWLIVRLDKNKLSVDTPLYLPAHILFPVLFTALLCLLALLLVRSQFMRPLRKLSVHLGEQHTQQAVAPLPPTLTERRDEIGTLAFAIEKMRAQLVGAKIKTETQANIPTEIPTPILRCSINRKILYANPAAKKHPVFFDGDKFDVVSASLSDLIRRAFQEAKPVTTTLTYKDSAFICQAFPVLDKGYVNLTATVKTSTPDENSV